MQLPSLQHIIRKSTATLKRFPLVLLSATVAVVVAIFLAEEAYEEFQFLFNIVLVAILGIPLFTVLKLVAEQHSWPALREGIASVLLI